MILVCNIGKFRVWAGQPFLAQVRLEAEGSDYLKGENVRNGLVDIVERPAVVLRPAAERQADLLAYPKKKTAVGINLSPRVIDYFKGLAKETGLPYQKLIDLYLLDCAKKRRKPDMRWAA